MIDRFEMNKEAQDRRMVFRLPTLSFRQGSTNSWLQVVGADLVALAVCIAGLVFIDHGNGNYEPAQAPFWWFCLYAVVVAPPYLIITKAFGRRPRWRLVALCLWVAFAVWTGFVEYDVYYRFMLSTW